MRRVDITKLTTARWCSLLTLGASLLAISPAATAAPLQQKLSSSASHVTFGIDSQSEALKMHGSIKEFSGTIDIDPAEITKAQIKLSIILSSATLPPDQIMQAVMLQTLLSRLPNRRTYFESTALEHVQATRYLALGKYTTGSRAHNITVPVTISKATRKTTEIRIEAREPFEAKKAPAELAALARGAQGTSGWASARLIFLASNPES
jgi:polyisoprenoid-binding protein YceI